MSKKLLESITITIISYSLKQTLTDQMDRTLTTFTILQMISISNSEFSPLIIIRNIINRGEHTFFWTGS